MLEINLIVKKAKTCAQLASQNPVVESSSGGKN
jgi:hypothetical protein